MIRVCPDCGRSYDDVEHWTYCPHDYFGMATIATNARGETRVCTSLDELYEFIEGKP